MTVFGYAPGKAGQRLTPGWASVAAVAAAALGAATASSGRLGVAVALAIGVIAIAVLRPSTILLLLIASIFLEVITLGGVTLSRLIAPIALFVVIVELIRGTASVRPGPPLVFALAYSMWALASGMWTVSTSHTITLLGSLAIALIYMLSFAALVDTQDELRRMLYVLAFASLLIGIASLASFAGVPILAGDSLQSGRAQGGVGDPNFFANVQLVAFPLLLVLAATEKRRWLRYGLALTALIALASVLGTLSRGGLIALVFVLLIIPFMPARSLFVSPRQKAAILVVLAVGVLVLFSRPGFRAEVVGRATTIFTGGSETGSSAGSGRTEIWKAARHSIAERPVTGLGFGAFPSVSNELLLRTPGVDLEKFSVASHPDGIEVHSAYLGTTADLGLVGLVLFLAFVAVTGLSLRHTARRAQALGATFVSRVANALVLSLVGWAISSVFIETETSRPLWIIAGLSLALPKLLDRAVPDTLVSRE